VIDFFSRITGSREIAEMILAAAETYKVPPTLAFAVAWEESRYRPKAINTHNRNGSIDRGLFQLNSRSFPKLSETEFFDPRINTSYGIAHLRWCLDAGGSKIVALAMYNAGSVQVNASGTPKTTLEYVGRILGSCRKIDSFFEAEIDRVNIDSFDPRIVPLGELAAAWQENSNKAE
jgi:soluble lytic murein transglycosylase-like protein